MPNKPRGDTPPRARSPESGRLVDRVIEIIAPSVTESGYVLWDVELAKEGGDSILRVTVDKPSGISIDDCEIVTRLIDPMIDAALHNSGIDYLEVFSPGAERTVRTDAHFAWARGREVELHLFAAVDGGKQFVGALTERTEKTTTITRNGVQASFENANISKVNIHYDFAADKFEPIDSDGENEI